MVKYIWTVDSTNEIEILSLQIQIDLTEGESFLFEHNKSTSKFISKKPSPASSPNIFCFQYSCQFLEKLHIYSNQIQQISGLESCIVLKELNLSVNQITSIKNLSRQVHLQNLFLSGNPIESFSQISEVGQLPTLRRLTLDCVNYGPCPVT